MRGREKEGGRKTKEAVINQGKGIGKALNNCLRVETTVDVARRLLYCLPNVQLELTA